MLRSLQIRNFALIENANIDLGEGLNVLSGETGSGKSILIQALELLLGARGSAELIRQGEEESEVTGLFVRGGEEISLRRVITRNGKNRSYLNERPVPVSVLEETGRGLVDLAGQNEHQVLMDAARHLELLDEFAGLESRVDSPLRKYRDTFASYVDLLNEKERLETRARGSREREEFLRFQLREIDQARIGEGEEEELQREKDVAKHAVRLREASARSEEALESGDDSALERVARIQKEILQAVPLDSRLEKPAERLEAALCELQEAAGFLRDYGRDLTCDPERLQEIEDRLALISRLKRKHGGTVESLLQKEEEFRKSLSLLDDFEGEMERMASQLAGREAELNRFAGELSRIRRKASEDLSAEVSRELKDLGMPSAKFSARLAVATSGVRVGETFRNERGGDDAEFLVAPNVGEGMHPLVKVASGGELSRIFLAIKKTLGAVRSAETCVFDEVDAGIGGRVADVVGRNLTEMAHDRQVICITHLPQIACYADHHYVIRKATEKGRTHTNVQKLQAVQREEEIARMLAGVKVTERAIAHAREMLKGATRG